MPTQYTEQQPDPLTAVSELAHWLINAGLHCALAILIGRLAAHQMRRRHLHWSWAAIVFVAAIAMRPELALLPDGELTIAVAALTAAARGRRWHREDLDAGADLAGIAAARLTPLEAMRRLTLAGVESLRSRRPHVSRDVQAPAELVLGRDECGHAVAIPYGGSAGGRHTLVVGATGSGKTVTQTLMAVCSIERGMGAVVIDPKGDRSMRETLERAAQADGRRFVAWTPAGGCVYNPYGRGGETEIADKVLAGERFTEPHYLRQAQRYLGHVVRALRASGAEVGLPEIVQNLDPGQLELLARTLPEIDANPTHAYLDSLTARQKSDLAGVRDRLATIVESDVGRWLDPHSPAASRLELMAAIRERAVVYIGLESDRRPLLAQMLGSAVIQDLQTVVAELQASPVATVVVIDEFSAVAAEQIVRLFGRARSAGLSLVLGTQEIADLRLPGAERLLEQVMGNLSALIVHRQVVPSSAQLVSEVAGTEGAWKSSRHSSGHTTRTRTREARLDVECVMGLGRGRAAVIVLGAVVRVRIASVIASRLSR
jgi:hypothetical protein